MALTSGAAIVEYGTQTTVITEAGTIAAAGFSTNVTALTLTDNVPLGDAVLAVTYALAPAAGDAVHLYRRDLNIDGVNGATVPTPTYKNIYVGSFSVDLVATAQYISLPDIPLSADQEFYVENDSAQTISAGMTLKVTPKSYNAKV